MTVKALIPAAAVAAFALLLLWIQAVTADRDRARREAAAAETRTVAAETRGALEAVAARAVQAAQTHEIAITLKAREAANDVAEAAGGETPVPAAVLDRWASAVDGLRADAAARRPAVDPGG